MKRSWLVLLLILLVAEVILAHFLLLPHKRDIQNLSLKASSLDSKIKGLQTNLRRAREQLENTSLENVRVDYFKRQNLASELQIPRLLEDISKLVKELKLKYVAVRAETDEDYKHYRKRSFSIKASSKYTEIVRFIDQLENNLGLTISNFSIQQGKANPAWRDVGFILSSSELKYDAPLDIEEEASADQLLTKAIEPKQIGKDPLAPPQRLLAGLAKRKLFSPPKPKLMLNGIMDLMGKKAAIINNDIVREGDVIKKHRIISIGRDRVTVHYRKKKYDLKLKGLASIKGEGFKKTIPLKSAN